MWNIKVFAGVVLSTVCLSSPAANIVGTDDDETLYGSDGTDYFFGGDGADTFVINHISAEPDEILDFEPSEGDTIKIDLPSLKDFRYEKGVFSLSPKGVLKMRVLDSEDAVSIVNTRRTDMTFKVDQRKKQFLLTFDIKMGNRK